MRIFWSLMMILGMCGAGRADDWPQWLGPRRDGTSLDKGLIDAFPKTGPRILWQRKVGEGFAGPVIAGGRLIIYSRVGNDEHLDCIDARISAARWGFQYPVDY